MSLPQANPMAFKSWVIGDYSIGKFGWYLSSYGSVLGGSQLLTQFLTQSLQQKRAILRSKYPRKQQRNQIPKTRSSEQEFLANF
jgi:heme exporter protein D